MVIGGNLTYGGEGRKLKVNIYQVAISAMEKIDQGKDNRECSGQGKVEWNLAILHRMVREGLSDKITF